MDQVELLNRQSKTCWNPFNKTSSRLSKTLKTLYMLRTTCGALGICLAVECHTGLLYFREPFSFTMCLLQQGSLFI